ncbi:MAG TPA: hypothetical protein VF962_05910 [Gemmatimonadaceae bacterium]
MLAEIRALQSDLHHALRYLRQTAETNMVANRFRSRKAPASSIERIGRRIHLGTPLGLGKPNHLVNEFFRRAREDPRIELRIFTALTLAPPHWDNDLGRRLLEPLSERLFAGYPKLEYFDPLRRGTLPDNIRVSQGSPARFQCKSHDARC